jgi:hypothetical protein
MSHVQRSTSNPGSDPEVARGGAFLREVRGQTPETNCHAGVIL